MKSIFLYPPEETAPDGEPRVPTLDYYEPFGNLLSHAAVLILPGGSYRHLSAAEGEGYAGIFRLWGLHSFVCNYRLGTEGHRHPAMLEDAARALRHIRMQADELGIDPEKIIVVGSSAGGHVAASLLTEFDQGIPGSADPLERISSRPDLGILCYPVITMNKLTHEPSRSNLLGENLSQELIDSVSTERHVKPNTPPCFIWHTYGDPAVPVENALLFSDALRRRSVPFELHIYQDGSHGLGMKDGIPWISDCLTWLLKRLPSSKTS